MGFCNLHPWEFERYSGEQMMLKLKGMLLMQKKSAYERWDVMRTLMAHIANWSGKSTKKGVHVKPEDILRLPGDKQKKAVKLNIKKLWEKHHEDEKRSGNN